jgi:hypothetical protein
LSAPIPGYPLAWLGEDADHVRTVAEIWATVDLARSLAEFRTGSMTVAPGGAAMLDTIDEPLLGARVLLVSTADGSRVALAEPSTEGRLAAALARNGEGHVGTYLEIPVDIGRVGARAAAARVALSRPETGPFGRSLLVIPDRPSGQHLILVERPAVPSRP